MHFRQECCRNDVSSSVRLIKEGFVLLTSHLTSDADPDPLVKMLLSV